MINISKLRSSVYAVETTETYWFTEISLITMDLYIASGLFFLLELLLVSRLFLFITFLDASTVESAHLNSSSTFCGQLIFVSSIFEFLLVYPNYNVVVQKVASLIDVFGLLSRQDYNLAAAPNQFVLIIPKFIIKIPSSIFHQFYSLDYYFLHHWEFWKKGLFCSINECVSVSHF